MIRVLINTQNSYPVDKKIVKKAVIDTVVKNKSGTRDIEVSVCVVGEREMDELSRKYLHDKLKHEVLSFPLDAFNDLPDGSLRLGDIILCWPQVLLAAARDGVMVDDEVYRLTSHSVEHLLGKHHPE